MEACPERVCLYSYSADPTALLVDVCMVTMCLVYFTFIEKRPHSL